MAAVRVHSSVSPASSTGLPGNTSTPSPPGNLRIRRSATSSLSPNDGLAKPGVRYEDIDIRALQARVHELQARKRILTASIASYEQQKLNFRPTLQSSLPAITIPQPPTNPGISPSTLSSTYRISSGITAFHITNPSPTIDPKTGKQYNETLIGIRIEAFSGGRYLPPHYMILSVTPEKATANREGETEGQIMMGGEVGYFTLRHATIPPYLNLGALAQKYLPQPQVAEKGGMVGVGRKQDLEGLVREVRRGIVLWVRRGEVLDRIKMGCVTHPPTPPAAHVGESGQDISDEGSDGEVEIGIVPDDDEDEEAKEDSQDDTFRSPARRRRIAKEKRTILGRPTSVIWDEARENVSVDWRPINGEKIVQARIRLSSEGKVVKCVVVSRRQSRNGNAAGGDGREIRLRRIESRIRVGGLKVLGG